MRSAIMLIGLLIALLALATASASGSPSACIAGVKKVGGGRVIVNCGPAKATVTVGGKIYRFSQGLCQGSDVYTVNIGTLPYSPPPRKLRLSGFNVTLPKARAGKYRPGPSVSVSWQINVPGTYFHLSRGTITLAKGLKRGSFAGDVDILPTNGATPPRSARGSGSWTC